MKLRFTFMASLTENDMASLARVNAGIEDGWHDWCSPDPGSEILVPYFQLNPTHRELLEKSYVNSLAYSMGASPVVAIVHGRPQEINNDGALTLTSAISYLSQPLLIFVESQINDGHPLRVALTAVAPSLFTTWDSPRPALHFQHAGGKAQALQLIQHTLSNGERRGVRPRIFVILDSDAKYPGHLTTESKDIHRYCQINGVPLVLLRKRAIENYVADDILARYLETHPEIAESVSFICSLTHEQRNHYPIKSGLKVLKGVPTVKTDGERLLYGGLPSTANGCAKLPRLMEFFVKHVTFISVDSLKSRQALEEFKEIAARLEQEM